MKEKLKVMSVVGTRPEIIRLSRVIAALDQSDVIEHIIVHTGQNYDYELNQIFFEDLGIRKPDFFLDAAEGTAMSTIGNIFIKLDQLIETGKLYREKKIYWWGHGTLGNQGFFGRKFRLFFYKLSEGLLSYNKYCFLPDKNFFDIKKVFYVGNSNNFDSIYQGDFILNKKPFFDVIYIGRLQKRKGVVEFSKLWDQVQTRFLSITGVNIRFNIYGDGECKNDIVSCDNLILHGHKNPTQIRQILLSSDLAVCPKAVGLALYHVNWFGIPLITLKNNIDHGPEINDLKEKINGSFFNEFNVDSILEEILFWFQEIKVNNLLIKEQCRNEVKNFSPSSVAKKINKVIYGN